MLFDHIYLLLYFHDLEIVAFLKNEKFYLSQAQSCLNLTSVITGLVIVSYNLASLKSIRKTLISLFTTRSKQNSGKKTKYKKTKCRSDKIQKDRIQIIQNAKRQNANPTKYKKKICKYDKTEKDKIQN